MEKRDFLKDYLRQRGIRVLDSATKRFKSDVYANDQMSEAEIQQRLNEIDIQDLDKTVNDSGEDVQDEPKDEPPADVDKKGDKFPKDLGWGMELLEEDPSNEYRG